MINKLKVLIEMKKKNHKKHYYCIFEYVFVGEM
jgi:hypothetical protein